MPDKKTWRQELDEKFPTSSLERLYYIYRNCANEEMANAAYRAYNARAAKLTLIERGFTPEQAIIIYNSQKTN